VPHAGARRRRQRRLASGAAPAGTALPPMPGHAPELPRARLPGEIAELHLHLPACLPLLGSVPAMAAPKAVVLPSEEFLGAFQVSDRRAPLI